MADVQAPPPSPLPANIYKILDTAPPDPLPEQLMATPLDAKDGFIHLSSGEQIPETARLYFSQHSHLWLLELPLQPLDNGSGTVKWEGPRGCAHLYDKPIGAADIKRVITVERKQGEKWEDLLQGLGTKL